MQEKAYAANVRSVKVEGIQVDEIWPFTYAKRKNVATANAVADGAGDIWTWTAIEADAKLSDTIANTN